MSADLMGQSCALATALTWASAMVLFKRSGETFGPLQLNLLKNTIGLVLLGVTFFAVGERCAPLLEFQSSDVLILLVSGFLGIAVADTLFLYALNLVGVGIQSIVDCSYSPLVILFAWLMLGDELSTWDYLGAALVLSAVLVATRHVPPPGRTRGQLARGVAVGLVSIALIAYAIVLAKPALTRVPLLWATVLRLLAGTLPLVAWVFLIGRSNIFRVFKPHRMWRFAVPGAILGGYVSMLLWVAGFKYTQPGIAGVLNQTSTIFAITLAAIFLKEPLTRRKLFAVGLALVGVLLVAVDLEPVN